MQTYSPQNDSLSDASFDSDVFAPDSASDLASAASAEGADESGAEESDHKRSKTLVKAPLKHNSLWSTSVDVLDREGAPDDDDESSAASKGLSLVSLNLAHNSFSVVPRCLACFCPNLARLNLSYNSIASFGSVSNYPLTLKHLDLSYNQIDNWPGDIPFSSSSSSSSPAIYSSESLCYADILNCDVASGQSSLTSDGRRWSNEKSVR